MVDAYLDAYLQHHDDSAFHSLREIGAECFPALPSKFNSVNSASKICLLFVAREIRDQVAQEFLLDVVRDSEEESVWKNAIEGLAYQALPDFLQKLSNLISQPTVERNPKKVKYVEELLILD
jgi:hypothetical protein